MGTKASPVNRPGILHASSLSSGFFNGLHLIGDDHGQPPLVADHFVAMTTLTYFGASVGALNAFDWYGTWKWLDALMSCSFANQDCQSALGDTPQQRFMGTWSDGVPVTEPQVSEAPKSAASPAATPAV
jgi:hypothetical protein